MQVLAKKLEGVAAVVHTEIADNEQMVGYGWLHLC